MLEFRNSPATPSFHGNIRVTAMVFEQKARLWYQPFNTAFTLACFKSSLGDPGSGSLNKDVDSQATPFRWVSRKAKKNIEAILGTKRKDTS